MVRRLVVKILVSTLALWVADHFLPGFSVTGGFVGYLTAGAVLGLLNALVRPLLKLVTFPLILITFGFFTVVINAAMLLGTAHLTGLIAIDGVSTFFWAMFIISLVQVID